MLLLDVAGWTFQRFLEYLYVSFMSKLHLLKLCTMEIFKQKVEQTPRIHHPASMTVRIWSIRWHLSPFYYHCLSWNALSKLHIVTFHSSRYTFLIVCLKNITARNPHAITPPSRVSDDAVTQTDHIRWSWRCPTCRVCTGLSELTPKQDPRMQLPVPFMP